MNVATLCLVAALAAYTIWAFVRIVRRRKAGGCCGCSSCPSCTSASRDKGGCPSCGQQGCEDGILPDAKKDQPNRETIAAMLEAERVAKAPSVRGYDDLDEAFAELKK